MPREHLQHSKLENIKPGDRPKEHRDTKLPGLLLRVQPRTDNGGGGSKTWYFEYRRFGKRNRVRIGPFPKLTPTDARREARRKLAELEAGKDPGEEARLARHSISLRALIENHYLPWHEVHRKQTAAIKSRLLSGFDHMLDRKVESLSLADFNAHRTWRRTHTIKGARGPASTQTINVELRAMHAALAWAVENGLIVRNPLAGLRRERVDKSRPFRALTDAEERAVLSEVDKGPADFFRPMLIVSLDTGIRRNEARGITWADVDLEAGTLTVPGDVAKNGQTRTVPLTPRARAALQDWQVQSNRDGASRVFPVPEKAAYDRWRKVCAACGIEGVRWHDLRHTFGSRLALAGVPVTVLMKLMGHSNLATSQVYLHSTADDATAAIAALAGREVEK